MIKRIAYILFGLLLLAYILFSVFSPKTFLDEKVCGEVHVVIADTLERYFISEKDVVASLRNAGLYPVGKMLKDIDTDKMETSLEKNKLIKQVEVYKTTGGAVRINVHQRIPLLRVMSVHGDYYIDTEGKSMPVVSQYAAYVPLATGYVDKELAQDGLFRLARYLRDHKMWDAQIEQIYVYPNKDLELTPRVGNHQILLGKVDDFETKLDNLKLFYDKALNKAGWNRYSRINLKFKNQIICTRR